MEDSTWEHEKLAKVKIRAYRGHVGGVNTCCFVNGRNMIVSGGDDKTIRIWGFGDGRQQSVLTGHSEEITCCRVGDLGRRIVSTSFDKYLIIWDTVTGEPLVKCRHDGITMTCDISYDEKYVVSASDLDNLVFVWDLREKKSIKTFDYHTSTVLGCRFQRHSYRFCTTGMDYTSNVVDMLNYRDDVIPHKVLRLQGHINMISTCDFSGDGRRLCTGSWDKRLLLWDIHAGSYRRNGPVVLQGHHEGCISSCRFSKDGKTVLSSCLDETLILWDVENACMKFSLQGHTGWVTDCDFSDDEKFVISSSKDGTVRVWNIENSDDIPIVLQIKKSIGLRLLPCQNCGKQFSINQAADANSVKYCVFCRLDFQSLES